MTEPHSESHPRWLRFSLRTMLVAVLAVGVLCARYVVPAKRQQWATESLERVGMQISYDYQRQPSPPQSTRYSNRVPPPGWPLARRLIGKDFFQTATSVSLDHSPLTVDELTPVRALTLLRELCLYKCHLGDEHIKSLAGLTTLQVILLGENKITDCGLAHLANLTELQSLSITNNQIVGGGLVHLKALTNLRSLYLQHNPVSDDAMIHIACFTSLQNIGLGDSNVSDEGLERLAPLTNLQNLGLSATYVTKPAVEELQKRLPNCKIESYGLRKR